MTTPQPCYQNGCVYKFVVGDQLVYIGSTSNWSSRMYQHKCVCNNPNNKEFNRAVYQWIRANGGWDNVSVELVERYPCECKKQLDARERHWIRELRPLTNKYTPGAFAEAGGERQYMRQWYQENREQLREYKRQHYRQRVTCEHCGKQVRRDNLPRHQRSKVCQAIQLKNSGNNNNEEAVHTQDGQEQDLCTR